MIHRVYVMFELIDQKGQQESPEALPNMVSSVQNSIRMQQYGQHRARIIGAHSVPEAPDAPPPMVTV